MKLLVFSTTYGFNQTDILVTDAVSYILSRHPEGLSFFFSILTAPNKLLHWKISDWFSPSPLCMWRVGEWLMIHLCRNMPPTWRNFNLNSKNSLCNWHSYMEQLRMWLSIFRRTLHLCAVYIKSHTHTQHTHVCVIPWSLGSQLDILILRFTIKPLREIKIWIEIPLQVNQTLVT